MVPGIGICSLLIKYFAFLFRFFTSYFDKFCRTWILAHDPLVGELVRLKEDEGLEHLDVVQTVTDDACQTRLSYLLTTVSRLICLSCK
jgi:hypothetical protein